MTRKGISFSGIRALKNQIYNRTNYENNFTFFRQIQPELITLDQGHIHQMKEEVEEKPLDSLEHKELILKFKMKGKNSAKRRFHRRFDFRIAPLQ